MTDSDMHLLVAADTTIDFYLTDETGAEPGSEIRWFVGGTGANVATGVGLLDGSATLMTNLGTDLLGAQATDYLNQTPVSTQYLTRVETASPLTLYVPERAGGPRWDAWIDGECFGFTLPEDISTAVQSTDWLYLSGTTLPRPVNWDEVTRLLELAAKYDVRVAFDLNGRGNQWSDSESYTTRLETVLPHCDVVFASQEDLSLAGISSATEDLRSFLPDDRSMHVFVTRGAGTTTGLKIVDGELREEIVADPHSVEVQDPAGGGDAFAASVLSALFDGGYGFGDLLRIGNAAGAAAVTTPGAFRREDVETFDQFIR